MHLFLRINKITMPTLNYYQNADLLTALRSYEHASILYGVKDGTYDLLPKNGWIYYVIIHLNPDLASWGDAEFQAWFGFNSYIGLLAKSVDLPKFTVQTETLNQYNKKTIIQKQITYNPITINLHDDGSNLTTNLWNYYFSYYYADSITSGISNGLASINPKYTGPDADPKSGRKNYNYGFDNGIQSRDMPFIDYIEVFQLSQQMYTSFTLVNPKIKDWVHDTLDQTQGNKLLTNKMTVEYETVRYDTKSTNFVTQNNPGFANLRYDQTPTPLKAGNLGAGGRSTDIFGGTQLPNQSSPLDYLNAVVSGVAVSTSKGVPTTNGASGGYNITNSVFGQNSNPTLTVVNTDGSTFTVPAQSSPNPNYSNSNYSSSTPAGINLFTGNNSSVNGVIQAIPVNVGNDVAQSSQGVTVQESSSVGNATDLASPSIISSSQQGPYTLFIE